MKKAITNSVRGAYTGARVLVVDDLFVNRQLLQIHLEKLGCEIITAREGAEAVSKAMKENYDLIFMDIHMPYMSGIIAAREIKERMKTPPIIVGITADHSASIRAKCLAEGMIDVLVKPIRMQQLVAVLGHMRAKLDARSREEESDAAEAGSDATTSDGVRGPATDAATEGATDTATEGAENTPTN